MNQPTLLSLIINFDKRLSHSTHICKREDWSDDALNETCGAGNWLITPTASLPADFSVDTYTIVDGELVRLPAEVIAERKAAALRAAEQAATAAEIARLKEYLTATDWAVVKCLEIGAPLAEIYPELAAERIEARASINTLEEQTKTTAQ